MSNLNAAETCKFNVTSDTAATIGFGGWWTAPPPPTATPSAVRAVSFSNLTATSFTVRWDAPESDGGTAITGYGLQRKLGDAAWPPTDQVVVVGREPRDWTFEDLREGTHWVRIQACNGKNSCADWPTTGTFVTIPGTDQVRNLRAVGSVGRLTVTWTAPADTGDQTITRYLVQYRIQGTTPWETVPGTVTGLSVTIGNLRNEATYDVQVRACYNATNADCGTAAHTTGTPTADPPAQPDPIETPDPTTPVAVDIPGLRQRGDSRPHGADRAQCYSAVRASGSPDVDWFDRLDRGLHRRVQSTRSQLARESP